MCIIAIPNMPILDRTRWSKKLDLMIKDNPDGNGVICELDTGDITWYKGIAKSDILNISKMLNPKRMYLHCRAASHGTIIKEMTHPFLISPNRNMYLSNGQLLQGEALVMQDGVFPTLQTDDVKSDTALMCETIKKYGKVESAKSLITLLMTIAPMSKFVVATLGGVWRTINFTKYADGYYSNNTHIAPKAKTGVKIHR